MGGKRLTKGPLIPFKGKGALAGRAAAADLRRRRLALAMDALVDNFRARYPPPQPLRLVVHETGRTRYLRWRRPGHASTYLELDADDDAALELLAALPAAQVTAWLAIHRRALRLNAAYSAARHEAQQLAACQRKARQADAIARRLLLLRALRERS